MRVDTTNETHDVETGFILFNDRKYPVVRTPAEHAGRGLEAVDDEFQRERRAVAADGSVGQPRLAEAYAGGMWDSPDLAALVRLAARNATGLDRLRALIAPVRVPVQRGRAYLRASTHISRQRDIAAHYDPGNELFSRMLDPTMSYSCAVFEHSAMTLEDAQIAKLDLICDKLDLGPDDRLLEIGTGWGARAIHAASTRGCRVTTTTISREHTTTPLQRSAALASITGSRSCSRITAT